MGSETPRCKGSGQVVLSLIDHVNRCKADAPLRGISDFVVSARNTGS